MVSWVKHNADRVTLVLGAGLMVAGIQQAWGNEAAMVIGGLLLIAGSLRRTP